MVLDVAAGEAAEKAGRVEELWAESVRRFHGERHHQNARAWHDYHARQLAALEETFAALTTRHRSERDRYGRLLGIPVPEASPGADDPGVA